MTLPMSFTDQTPQLWGHIPSEPTTPVPVELLILEAVNNVSEREWEWDGGETLHMLNGRPC